MDQLARVFSVLEPIVARAGASVDNEIVLGGNVGVDQAAAAAGVPVMVPVVLGRGDATNEATDAPSAEVPQPIYDWLPQLVSS